MKNKKKMIIYTILFSVVVLVFSYFYAYIDKNVYLYDRKADTATFVNTGILNEGEEVTQTFVSENDTIDGVNIKVSLSGDVKDVVLHYALMDVETGKVVEKEVAATKLSHNKFNQLKFPKITKTEGKEYKLILSVENTDEQNGLSFYKIPDGTLVARVISHKFDLETFIVSAGVLMFIYAFMSTLYKSFR